MRYRKEIDGLRAIAVLPVIFFHADATFVSGGYVGVDIFFVISGFLITSNILAEKDAGTFSLLTFYERRIRRILPALFAVMACSIPVAWLWLLPSDLRSFSQSLVAVSTLLPNYFFYRTSGYFDTSNELKPLLHTWSLGVEEQYYLLCPLLILVLWRFGKWRIWLLFALTALTSLMLAQWSYSKSPAFSFYMLPTRGWEILVGALVAIHHKHFSYNPFSSEAKSRRMGEAMSLLGIVLIVYAVFVFDSQTEIPGLYALIPTVGAVLLIVFATHQTLIGRVLSSRWLVGIGLISYSLYLWHQPILAFVRYRAVEPIPASTMPAILVGTTLVAFLSWKFVEKPFRDMTLISRKSVFILAGVLTIMFLAVGALGVYGKGWPTRMPESVRQAIKETELDGKLRDDGGCNIQKNDFVPAHCIKGAQEVRPRFVLLGDSHAAMLAHELGEAFKNLGLSYMQYTKNACPFALGLTMSPSNNCDKYQAEYLKYIDSAQGANTYIIASRWSDYVNSIRFENEGAASSRRKFSAGKIPLSATEEERGQRIVQAYAESVTFLLRAGKRVILVYPIPAQPWDVPRRAERAMVFTPGNAREMSTEYSEIAQQDAAVTKAFDAIGLHKNLIRIRPAQKLCNTIVPGRCAATENGHLLYIDDNHLSNYGARFIVEEIMRQLKVSSQALDG